MPTSQASGTQACTVTTEHTLTTITAAGTYVLSLNLNPAAAGDIFEARAYLKVLTGSTERVLYFDTWADGQPVDDQVKFMVPIPTLFSVKFTLKQTAGVGRSIEWNAINIA
jgi:hypothetical protein